MGRKELRRIATGSTRLSTVRAEVGSVLTSRLKVNWSHRRSPLPEPETADVRR